jgi:hypothetical protein
MTDRELLTILHSRIENKAIRLELSNQGSGFAQIKIVAGGWGERIGFEAMAYTPIVGEL